MPILQIGQHTQCELPCGCYEDIRVKQNTAGIYLDVVTCPCALHRDDHLSRISLAHGPIGSLSNGRFYCVPCTPSYSRVVPVYRSNIGSYAQHCSKCKREVVKGAQGWPNLFD